MNHVEGTVMESAGQLHIGEFGRDPSEDQNI